MAYTSGSGGFHGGAANYGGGVRQRGGGGLRAAGRRATAWGPKGPRASAYKGGGGDDLGERARRRGVESRPDSACAGRVLAGLGAGGGGWAGGPAAWLGWASAQSGAAFF